ncbi:MAG: phenylalanine--tRNA ligase subunit beta [Gemmatimonadetes bacterium]|nr:phenylalanine--tRNA ligase subunit beta [Gemmatimonadota bacterium]
MNISINWLSALLDIKLDPDDVAHKLAMLGAPVEAIEPVHQNLAGIIIAEVERVEQHPNADRLTLCHVNNGTEVVEVVCGAPNVQAGKKYPYAAMGTVLPGGLEIKGRKIRGIQSNGMLCSASELELGTDHEGILELDTDVPAGTPLLDALPIGDFCLDVEVTPNRPDLLCHKGVARDLGAVLRRPVKLPSIPGAPGDSQAPVQTKKSGVVGGVEVTLLDVEGCPRYMAAVIEGITVGPSPDWLQARLRSIGQRPINNVVDATNYILFEVNQPMHAFDRAKLRGSKIIIRRGGKSETLTLLDGEERTVDSTVTAICDAEHAIAIGGVMGGRDSEVSQQTTDVVLECAYFDAKRIRATRKAMKMSTEASYRFERGTDLQGMADAIQRAVRLIIAVAGGAEAGPPVDLYPKPVKTPAIFLRPERVAHLLGVEISQKDIEGYLTSLGFAAGPKSGRLAVHVPGWRPDVAREEDLVEEIARLRGYDSFPTEMRPLRPSSVPSDVTQTTEARVRRVLTALGLNEARTLSLGPARGKGAQAVLNPLSTEEAFLRTDLIAGLIRSVERNWAVRERNIRLFEVGSVFHAKDGGGMPVEGRHVAGVITGARRPPHWSDGGKYVDFDRWDVKSLFEEAVQAVGARGTVSEEEGRWVLRDRNGELCGWADEVDADRPAWAAPLFGFELDAVAAPKPLIRFQPLPGTPPVERDLALLLPTEVTARQVEEVVAQRGGKLLESTRLFDEFRGKDMEGRSVAWRLVFRSPDRTLRDKDVDAVLRRILEELKERLGVERREA